MLRRKFFTVATTTSRKTEWSRESLSYENSKKMKKKKKKEMKEKSSLNMFQQKAKASTPPQGVCTFGQEIFAAAVDFQPPATQLTI